MEGEIKVKCKQCKKSYGSLADGLCFHCDQTHWQTWFKQFNGEKKR